MEAVSQQGLIQDSLTRQQSLEAGSVASFQSPGGECSQAKGEPCSRTLVWDKNSTPMSQVNDFSHVASRFLDVALSHGHSVCSLRPKASRQNAGNSPRSRGHLLLLDDEPVVIEVLKRVANMLGFTASGYQCPVQALTELEHGVSPVELVIADVCMPGMNGWDFARALYQQRPEIPVILISGNQESMSLEKAEGTNVCGYVAKPFNMNELGGEIDRVFTIAKRRAEREGVTQ